MMELEGASAGIDAFAFAPAASAAEEKAELRRESLASSADEEDASDGDDMLMSAPVTARTSTGVGFDALISAQNAAGKFTLTPAQQTSCFAATSTAVVAAAVMRLVEACGGAVEGGQDAVTAALDAARGDEVLQTLLVLCVLYQHHGSRSDEWGLVARKGAGWVASNAASSPAFASLLAACDSITRAAVLQAVEDGVSASG
jgi:hypothetical protein